MLSKIQNKGCCEIMFADFVKAFDRNYIIAYLFPVLVFITMTYEIVSTFFPNALSGIIYSDTASQLEIMDLLWNGSIIFIITMFISIIMMIINLELIRLLEGYSSIGKEILLPRQIRNFEDIQSKLEKAKKDRDDEVKEKGEASDETRRIYRKLKSKYRNNFPPRKEYILGTEFGNVIRSFELYPMEMYGIDSIAIWDRITCLVPKEHIDYLGDAKASVDFAINIFYLMMVVLIGYVVLLVITRCISQAITLWWIPIFAIGLAFFAYRMAISSARKWGLAVKSVFDLYRYDLLKKLDIDIPKTLDEEKKIWRELNQAFLYWDIPNIKK